MHSPNADSSAALASHSAALRAVMYTRHPARTSPDAIIAPIPLDPPVTTATLPLHREQRCNAAVARSLFARAHQRPFATDA